jgi:hypothetical protein
LSSRADCRSRRASRSPVRRGSPPGPSPPPTGRPG